MSKKSTGRGKMPTIVRPMLCTLVKSVTSSSDYLYEVKWDGYRITAFCNGSKVWLNSRSGLDYTKKYPLIAEAVKALRRDVILDGEVVVFNEEGKPDFNLVQNYNGDSSPLSYYVFDLLWLDGENLMSLPLDERKHRLEMLVGNREVIRFSESFDQGKELYEKMLEMDMEGIVAKRKDSVYLPGVRGNAWLKIPTRKRQEFVIGGWAESDRGRAFRSLLFGAYIGEKFRWVGRSGGGYKEKQMPAILKQLQKLEIDESPFENKVLDTKGALIHWVKPELVANFEFATWTDTGRIRKPATFLGFRNDKPAREVILEMPKSEPEVRKDVSKKKEKIIYLNDDSNWKKYDAAIKGKPMSEFPMDNCTVILHDVERELWDGVRKGDLVLYYNEMAALILPYLKDRPQSLNLKLTTAGGPTTFIKDMENRQPDCAEVFIDERRVKKKGKRSQIDYLVCNNAETLLYMIDYGCVDVNPWASRRQNANHPDFIWIDLDPTVDTTDPTSEERGFSAAIETAQATHDYLSSRKIKAFVKTSGKTGLHIYIPCNGFDFRQSRQVASHIADEIHALVPDITTRKVTIRERGKNVYIDVNQNDYADTLAAPYSVRPYHEPLISTPLDWKEVKHGLDRYNFNMTSIKNRIAKKKDLFAGVLDVKVGRLNQKKLKDFL